jgi:hypothetical protein
MRANRGTRAGRREVRAFVTLAGLLLLVIALVAWAGWFAPWSRSDPRVKVHSLSSAP